MPNAGFNDIGGLVTAVLLWFAVASAGREVRSFPAGAHSALLLSRRQMDVVAFTNGPGVRLG
jgi:hypothetical protein